MFLLNIKKMMPGDIVLTRSNNKNSSLICKITNSSFSHAIMFVGDSSYIHSDMYGVHSSNSQRLLIENIEYAKVLRINNADAIEQAIIYARSQVGTSYSKAGAANAFVKLFTKVDVTRQYCSRLVAKAYEAGGVKLVENSDACLPQEIADSIYVYEVKDCLYVANAKEISFACSYDPMSKQSEITNNILESARKLLGDKVQSLSHITSALIDDPKYDYEITKIYESSGYLTMWQYEMEKNAWRYNIDVFRALQLSESEKKCLARDQLKMANRLLNLYKNNLEQYFYIKELYRLQHANQQFLLYKKLVENVLDIKFTAEEIISG